MNTDRLVAQWEQRLLLEGRAEGKAEGRAEGKAEGLRLAVLDLCELLEIAVSPAGRGFERWM